jgi:hypothetical protein
MFCKVFSAQKYPKCTKYWLSSDCDEKYFYEILLIFEADGLSIFFLNVAF